MCLVNLICFRVRKPIALRTSSFFFILHCAPARRGDFMLVTKCSISSAILWASLAGKLVSSGDSHWNLAIYCHLLFVDQVKVKKLPNPRLSSYDTIAEARMDPIIMAKLHFFMSVSRRFQPFLIKYQTDAPIIPFLGKDLGDLIRVGLSTIDVLMV